MNPLCPNQISIEDFLVNGDPESKDYRRLFNPSAREFGIRAAHELEPFVDSALSTFKLVSMSD